MKSTCRPFAAALLLAALSVDCRADLAPPRLCELHAAQELPPGDPGLAALKANPGHRLRTCTADGLPPQRLVVSVPVHSSEQVCRFTQQQLPDASDGGEPPLLQTFTRVVAGACPVPEPSDYVRTEDVPDELVLRLMRFGREIGVSATAFDHAFLGFADAQAPVRPPGFDDFRRAVVASMAPVRTVYRLSPGDGAFVVLFVDTADRSTSWRVTVELVAGKPVVRRFSAWIA